MTDDDFDMGASTTEASPEGLEALDTLETAELASLMNERDHEVPRAVRAALPQIVPAIEAVERSLAGGGRLVYLGAGTAGRIGALDAAEWVPTFGVEPGLVTARIAGGDAAFTQAVEGAEDSADNGAATVADLAIASADVVVGIASSGRTPYVVGALEEARRRGATTIGLVCNVGSPVAAAADLPIEVIVGPELISGSTRLKAGTAQKLVLNMISTVTMIRLGKTYGSAMVDLRATNHKLESRARRIVQRITGVGEAEAEAALRACDMDIKKAVVHLRLGVSGDEAATVLARHGGRLRNALGEGRR